MSTLVSGLDTPRYKVVRGHFYPLVLHFEQDLTKIAAKLFEKKLITATSCGEASNANQPSFDRSSTLMMKVLKKIEIDESLYDIFYSVLRELGELVSITNALEEALQKELGLRSNASPGQACSLPKNLLRNQRPVSWQGLDCNC
jgi:two-component SAPR family response regulator